MTSIKVLLITSEFPPQPGGIGNHAYHLAKELHGSDQEVTVLTDYRSKDRVEEDTFDRKQAFPIHRIERYTWLPFTYLKRIGKAIRLAQSSDVIVLSGKFSLWVGGILNLLVNRPLVAVVHGSELKHGHPMLQRYTRYCLQKMNVVIGVSKFTLSLLQDVPLKQSLVINNGFEIPAFAGMTKGGGRKIQDKEAVLKLITVGNLTQRKGQHNVIAALPALLKDFHNLEYHMVGIPTDSNDLIAQAQRLGVRDHITIHGRVSEEEKWKLLSEASVFIMLSETTDSGDVEGFGIAILEANALGLPAIGSRGCGIEDAIKSGYSGYLVAAKDPEAIADALKGILKNYEVFSGQAHRWSQRFTWDKVGVNYQEVLDALIESDS